MKTETTIECEVLVGDRVKRKWHPRKSGNVTTFCDSQGTPLVRITYSTTRRAEKGRTAAMPDSVNKT